MGIVYHILHVILDFLSAAGSAVSYWLSLLTLITHDAAHLLQQKILT